MELIQYFLTCESVIIDRHNRRSIINIYDRLQIQLPKTMIKLAFTLGIDANQLMKFVGKEDVNFKIELKSPTKELLARFTLTVGNNELKEYKDQTITSTLDLSERDGINFTEYGKHIASFSINGKQIAKKNLLIEKELDEDSEEDIK